MTSPISTREEARSLLSLPNEPVRTEYAHVSRPVNLWVDDLKDPFEFGDLFGVSIRGEWTWMKTASGARHWLFHDDPSYRPVVLALDNDLGFISDGDGRDLAKEMLDRVLDDPEYIPPAVLRCISFNPIAEDAINRTFADIRSLIAGRSA